MWYSSKKNRGRLFSRPSEGTAHLFLQYAQKTTRSNSFDTQPTVLSEESTSRSWEDSTEDLERTFVGLLQTRHGLSQDQSSDVARILTDVVQRYAEPCESTSSQGDYGSSATVNKDRASVFLLNAFTEKSDDGISAPEDDGPSTEKSSCLHEEINFLRSALRALALSNVPSTHVPVKKNIKMKNSDIKRCRVGEDCSEVFKPDEIHIHRTMAFADDVSDESSFLSDVTPSEEGIRIVSLEEELGRATRFHHRNHLQKETHLRRDIHGLSYLLYQRHGQDDCEPIIPSSSYESVNREGLSFPQLSKGEHTSTRARHVLHEIYFQRWQMTLQGHYTGMIQNLVPHGSGVLRFINGDFYCGQFECGLLHGEGMLLVRREGRILKYRGRFVRNEFVPMSDLSTLGSETCFVTL